jgi:hypothetical protein
MLCLGCRFHNLKRKDTIELQLDNTILYHRVGAGYRQQGKTGD